MEKVIFELSDNELAEIRNLYEKKTALENLVKIVEPANEELYTRITSDYTKVLSLFQKWWEDMSKKYQWEHSESGHWTVNFDTKEIILVD